eukprot:g1038.t1
MKSQHCLSLYVEHIQVQFPSSSTYTNDINRRRRRRNAQEVVNVENSYSVVARFLDLPLIRIDKNSHHNVTSLSDNTVIFKKGQGILFDMEPATLVHHLERQPLYLFLLQKASTKKKTDDDDLGPLGGERNNKRDDNTNENETMFLASHIGSLALNLTQLLSTPEKEELVVTSSATRTGRSSASYKTGRYLMFDPMGNHSATITIAMKLEYLGSSLAPFLKKYRNEHRLLKGVKKNTSSKIPPHDDEDEIEQKGRRGDGRLLEDLNEGNSKTLEAYLNNEIENMAIAIPKTSSPVEESRHNIEKVSNIKQGKLPLYPLDAMTQMDMQQQKQHGEKTDEDSDANKHIPGIASVFFPPVMHYTHIDDRDSDIEEEEEERIASHRTTPRRRTDENQQQLHSEYEDTNVHRRFAWAGEKDSKSSASQQQLHVQLPSSLLLSENKKSVGPQSQQQNRKPINSTKVKKKKKKKRNEGATKRNKKKKERLSSQRRINGRKAVMKGSDSSTALQQSRKQDASKKKQRTLLKAERLAEAMMRVHVQKVGGDSTSEKVTNTRENVMRTSPPKVVVDDKEVKQDKTAGATNTVSDPNTMSNPNTMSDPNAMSGPGAIDTMAVGKTKTNAEGVKTDKKENSTEENSTDTAAGHLQGEEQRKEAELEERKRRRQEFAMIWSEQIPLSELTGENEGAQRYV